MSTPQQPRGEAGGARSRRDWPTPDLVAAALGLILLNSWALASALQGAALEDGRLTLTLVGRAIAWGGWMTTTVLACLALWPFAHRG